MRQLRAVATACNLRHNCFFEKRALGGPLFTSIIEIDKKCLSRSLWPTRYTDKEFVEGFAF
jgi:hypothetical protein